MRINISLGNKKLGKIPSVSFPAIVTCRDCECKELCYGLRMERFRPRAHSCYCRNLDYYKEDPQGFWKEVKAALTLNAVFRFFVSGDMPRKEFVEELVNACSENPNCSVLVFTKRFEWVNEWIGCNGELPSNLKMIFSGWKGLQMSNPFLLPECHVRYKDGSTTADSNRDIIECSGNCSQCKVENKGCWTAKKGQQIIINQH